MVICYKINYSNPSVTFSLTCRDKRFPNFGKFCSLGFVFHYLTEYIIIFLKYIKKERERLPIRKQMRKVFGRKNYVILYKNCKVLLQKCLVICKHYYGHV